MKKYEFTGSTTTYRGVEVKRIRALRDFVDVRVGDMGGWIENEDNLSHEGNCWVKDEAIVYYCSKVTDNAIVSQGAKVSSSYISGNAKVMDDAYVVDGSNISDNAMVGSYARLEKCNVSDNAIIYGFANIEGGNFHSVISGDARVGGHTTIRGKVVISDYARVYGTATVVDNAQILDYANISVHAYIYGNAIVKDSARISGHVSVGGNTILSSGDMILSDADLDCNSEIGSSRDFLIFNSWWKDGRTITWIREENIIRYNGVTFTLEEYIANGSEGVDKTERAHLVNYINSISNRINN